MDQTEDNARIALIPWPTRILTGAGALALGGASIEANFFQARSPRLQSAIDRFAAPFVGKRRVRLDVHCSETGGVFPELGMPETYRLSVGPAGIELWADTEWGVLHGVGTLRQLVASTGELPYCEIRDGPRFPWRGLLVDVARHFIGVAALRRTIDGMAACKLNVLHLHLTDDQGFRFPSKIFPLVDGQQYTQAELRALVDYAAARGIRVVPEIDLPGHVTALLAAYPWMGSSVTQATRRFGVHEGCIDPSREAVYAEIAELLAEVAEVFPDRYLHIGGDEVSPGWWGNSSTIAAFMSAHGLPDVQALQAYFVNRVADMVRSMGKVPIGWDEVLHPDLAGPMVVQAWRGASARDRALQAGHPCIVSANYYLDLFFPADVHYRFDPTDPLPDLLAHEDKLLDDLRLQHVAEGMRWTHQWRGEAIEACTDTTQVLGGEACLFSELVTESLLDIRLWTRLPAMAERFWSRADVLDVDDFYRRWAPWMQQLKETAGVDLSVGFQEWMTAAGVSETWLPLVELLEPVKWYGRLLGEQALSARLVGAEMPLARPYDLSSSLDGVVDGLFPESLATRRLASLCALVDEGDADARQRLTQLAVSWRSLGARSDCLSELAPSAVRLGQVGAHLAAYLAGGVSARETLIALKPLNGPQGEYMLAVVPMLCGWLERA